ncbi:MAG TPA: hypothetical protein VJ885_03130 [Thermoanaerobaculia bacterium]|nr:hypothetical protein [Thermoanaerobaculia bacterium]
MKRSEYEQRRRALEEIHQADLGLIRSAHEARLRSLEALWLSDPEEDAAESPAPAPDARPAAAPRIARPPVAQALGDVLPELPELFDKNDVLQALGWTPDRAALFRALAELVHQRRIAVERFGVGRVATVYRKK